jgi:ATP-dependent Clp protease adaptor protein ClpS
MTIDTTIIKQKNTDTVLKKPGKFNVVFYNDDVTPIEFVIAILMEIFNHNDASATVIALAVHTNGKAVAGIYTHEIAEQKSIDSTNVSRTSGFPLVNKVEPA